MNKKEINSMKKRVTAFDRLVTKDMIKQMKTNKIKEKLPVYKEALPFAVPIFIAVIVTLLIGNMIFVVLGI